MNGIKLRVRSLGSIWSPLEVNDHEYKIRPVNEGECFSPAPFSCIRVQAQSSRYINQLSRRQERELRYKHGNDYNEYNLSSKEGAK